MANKVSSVPAIVLGTNALVSALAITPAAAWTHYRHGIHVYGYAPAHYVTVVRHPVYSYRHGYPVAVYNYYPAYGYGYGPGAVAGGIVNGAGVVAVNIVGGAAAVAGGILGWPYYGYYGYHPRYAYGYGYPVW
jgi:hypothetical protein